jgi:hypothetical protein
MLPPVASAEDDAVAAVLCELAKIAAAAAAEQTVADKNRIRYRKTDTEHLISMHSAATFGPGSSHLPPSARCFPRSLGNLARGDDGAEAFRGLSYQAGFQTGFLLSLSVFEAQSARFN